MNPMVLSGDAHISSMVAAYEVGMVTSKLRPVASSRAAFMMSPPVTITSASTEGTNSTLIGFSAEPTSAMGASVVVGVAVVVVAAVVVVVASVVVVVVVSS